MTTTESASRLVQTLMANCTKLISEIMSGKSGAFFNILQTCEIMERA
jgi:hypothetical protein